MMSRFRTCTTSKVIEHQTRRGETLENGCEPPKLEALGLCGKILPSVTVLDACVVLA